MPLLRTLPVRRVCTGLSPVTRFAQLGYRCRLPATTTTAPPIPHALNQLRLRRINTMASGASAASFTDTVVQAVKTIFPPELADASWDNTGLLVDQAHDARLAQNEPVVLLTNDLSASVVDEALRLKASVIVSYHPVIFSGLKSITNRQPMQGAILRLIAAGVAVYCPHSAVDAAPGGLNDWLCDILVQGKSQTKHAAVLEPITRPLPSTLQGAGYGRVVELSTPLPLSTLLKNLSAGLGNVRYMSVAMARSGTTKPSMAQEISTFAVCAGSGSSILRGSDAQLLVTGEMDHHEALRHVGQGQIVVTVFHSNSERQYWTQRLKPMLEKQLAGVLGGQSFSVVVSENDRDPYEVVDVSALV